MGGWLRVWSTAFDILVMTVMCNTVLKLRATLLSPFAHETFPYYASSCITSHRFYFNLFTECRRRCMMTLRRGDHAPYGLAQQIEHCYQGINQKCKRQSTILFFVQVSVKIRIDNWYNR
jgi:hypothetical protein